MRILQVAHGFPPDELAGTELLTQALSQALCDRGHDVTVFARRHQPDAEEYSLHEERSDGLTTVRVVNNYTHTTSFRLHYDNPFFNERFVSLLERCRPDVVHFQHVAHLSVSLIRLAATLGYPTVLSLHDFFFACHRVHLVDAERRVCRGPDRGERCVSCLRDVATPDEARRRFARMEEALRTADRVVVPSAFAARRIQECVPVSPDRLRIVAPGIRSVGTRVSRGRRTPPLRLLYVGVLVPDKGAHVLLEALRGLPPGTIEVSLYGAAPPFWQSYVDGLHERAGALPVRFCGTYAPPDLGAVLSAHDVLVMPGICEETFSLMTREALSAGMPVVAARRGALPEAVQDGVNGLLFEPEDAADLRRCLRRLVDEPELWERLSHGPTSARALDEYAADIETIYADVVPAERRERHRGTPMTPGQESPVTSGEERTAGVRSAGASSGVRVSVCIPTYNGAEFIADAIRSILAQSYREFELLVVDDGSADATLEIVRSFADPRIRVHQNEQRLGIPANWNRCVELAEGEYVCLFHQDDEMLPENLARKTAMLAAHPGVTFVHSAAEIMREDSAPTTLSEWIETAPEDFVADGHVYFRKLLLEGDCVCAPAVVVRRQHLLDLGGFDEELGYTPDYEMWMKLCVDGQAAFLSQPLIRYRWHGRNASHAYRFERGADEYLTASRKALSYYLEKTGRADEGQVLTQAILALDEHRRWERSLERGNVWLEEQYKAWQAIAEQREAAIHDQALWIAELEKAKTWLEEQRNTWERLAGEREAMIQEQTRWIEDLQRSIEVLQAQWRVWKRNPSEVARVLWGVVKPPKPVVTGHRRDEAGTKK